jgi:Sugar-transfer associated ATP-grasp
MSRVDAAAAFLRKIKSDSETAIRRALGKEFHARHWAEAKQARRSFENATGPTDPKLLRTAEEYAADVLGWRGYAPWLCLYAAVAGEFREGWIPDDYYACVVMPKMKGAYGRLSDLRALNTKVFSSQNFPDVACSVNGIFYTPSAQPIADSEIIGFLVGTADVLVFKADDTVRGQGISFLETTALTLGGLKELGNGVFQTYIRQHEFFSELMPSSVATLRITTAVDDEARPSVRACYLRVGRAGDTHITVKRRVRVAVDPATGRFSNLGFLPSWEPIDRHPDTGMSFEGRQIPFFTKCVSTVLALHAKCSLARCIGWDVVVDTDEEIRIMEWNGTHNDIKFSEATQGPCFAGLGWDRLHREQA